MELSKRLEMIAAQVHKGTNVLADIGTDHGYLPIYLCKKNIVVKAIACDINYGPLEHAKENILRFGFGNQIELRHGSGLTPLHRGEIDCAVLAGMGGMLMIDIFKESLETMHSLKQLIVQPQKDIEQVRRFLHQQGFAIEKEAMVFEEGKYYTSISAVIGEEQYSSEIEYKFGKKLIDEKNAVLKSYIQYTLNITNRVYEEIHHWDTEKARERAAALLQEAALLKEVLKCL